MSGLPVTVVVTWMDGKQEVYSAQNVLVTEGVLHLTQNKYPRSDNPARSIPLCNVRIWTVDEL